MPFLFSCNKESAPDCTITSPASGDEIIKGALIIIKADAEDEDGNVTEVRFEIDQVEVSSVSNYPFNYEWNTSGINLGSYSIKATAEDNDGNTSSDEITVLLSVNTIDGGYKPHAAFIADFTAVSAGSTIQFTDLSSNDPESWNWSFGDGETSDSQNPTHIYDNIGLYTVSLAVSNGSGFDEETKIDYITVTSKDGTSGTATYLMIVPN